MFWSGLYFKGRDMETLIEQKKTNSLAEWAKEGQGYSGYKTPMEEMAEQAIKSTQKAQYYNNLPAVQAIPEAQRQGVMDSYVSYFQNSQSLTQYYAQNRFMGYAFLSYLAQDAMISRGVHTLADEMTREWGELTTKEKEHENVVQTVTDEMERLEVQNKFKEAALKTGFFGGCLIFLDVREDPNVPLEDIELEKPLFKEGMDDFNKSKLLNKHLVGLRVIEPINLAPGVYNSIDPTAADFFEPEHYYVLGRKIHRSRFLYFADNIPPQVLKPVYLFFGIPLAQLAFTYVQDFYKAKEVCTRILQKFSCSAISTDIEKLIYANGKNAVKDRISTIAKYRDNDSILVLDKENEEFSQTNTPLSGLKEMWYASLELIPVIFGVPATKLLEISPSGFNSTGEFEMRNFYDSVHTKQTNVFDAPMKRLVEIICYTKGLDPDILAWAWKSLFKMSERESAEVNRMEADTAQIYYNMGVVGNDDIAKRLINDKDSGYNNIQIPERIDPFQIGEDDTDLTEETEETKETEEISEVKDDSDVFDPFPSEHAARVKDPSEFEEGSFRRKNIANGVDIIMGKLKGSDKMEVQTYRFDKKVFTEEQAKEWLKSHKADNKMFEPAVKDEAPKKGILSRILGIFDSKDENPNHDPKNGQFTSAGSSYTETNKKEHYKNPKKEIGTTEIGGKILKVYYKADKNDFLHKLKNTRVMEINPIEERKDVNTKLESLAHKDLINEDTKITAQVNREQRQKLASGDAIHKSIANGFSREEHFGAAALVDKLYKNAILRFEREDENGDPNVLSIRRLVAPIKINGKDAYAKLTLKESFSDKETHKRIYTVELHSLEQVEKGNAALDSLI